MLNPFKRPPFNVFSTMVRLRLDIFDLKMNPIKEDALGTFRKSCFHRATVEIKRVVKQQSDVGYRCDPKIYLLDLDLRLNKINVGTCVS